MYYTSDWSGYSKRIGLLSSLQSANQFGHFRGDNFALHYTLKLVKEVKLMPENGRSQARHLREWEDEEHEKNQHFT